MTFVPVEVWKDAATGYRVLVPCLVDVDGAGAVSFIARQVQQIAELRAFYARLAPLRAAYLTPGNDL